MRAEEVEQLVCPSCRSAMALDNGAGERYLERGVLRCRGCGRTWPIRAGFARLYEEERVRGTDRLMRMIYDNFPALHDPAVALLLPALQFEGAAATRDRYMARIELDQLTEVAAEGRRPRILEIGIGTGANLPLLERDLPAGLSVELWGMDLSAGMLKRCRRRLARHRGRRLRLLLADAHALPFPDDSFDRVFHVGAIASYRDPRTALAEMVRVARPGTPLVVADEQLDPERGRSLYHRLTFRAVTFYDPAPRAPTALLPSNVTDVREEQISRFYYCLSFRKKP